MLGWMIVGWITGYVWCRIWRGNRPEKASLLSLIAGYWLGRRQHDRETRR